MKPMRFDYFFKVKMKRTVVFFVLVVLTIALIFAAVHFTGPTEALY